MNYARPTVLNEALAILASGPKTILAGGTDLYPATTRQFLDCEVLDITAIEELRGIDVTTDGIRIGATTRWSDIIAADLPLACDALKLAAREVGSVQIQNSGTIGGNLCNASPAADGIPPLLILDAEVELASATGIRKVPLSQYVTGNRQTVLDEPELLQAVFLPAKALTGHSNFLKLGARKYLVISIAMVAVRVEIDGNIVKDAAISVGACSAVAKRLAALEKRLIGSSITDFLVHEFSLDELSPIDDIRADAQYRSSAAVELVRRALESCQ